MLSRRPPALRPARAVPPALAALAVLAALAPPAAAQGAGSRSGAAHEAPPDDPKRTEARALYIKGVDLVEKAQWAEALAAFEASTKLYPHATTTFNVGACERAL